MDVYNIFKTVDALFPPSVLIVLQTFLKCGKDFPLWGVDYDPRKDRIEIMLGRSGTVEGHLTHSIPSPREVRVVRGEDGRAEALEITLPQGQVVLRIHRD